MTYILRTSQIIRQIYVRFLFFTIVRCRTEEVRNRVPFVITNPVE